MAMPRPVPQTSRAPVVLTAGDRLGDLGGDVEVAAVAVVVDLVAAIPEVGGQALLQGGADGDRYP
jgi:hypothetical protein